MVTEAFKGQGQVGGLWSSAWTGKQVSSSGVREAEVRARGLRLCLCSHINSLWPGGGRMVTHYQGPRPRG